MEGMEAVAKAAVETEEVAMVAVERVGVGTEVVEKAVVETGEAETASIHQKRQEAHQCATCGRAQAEPTSGRFQQVDSRGCRCIGTKRGQGTPLWSS